MELLAEGPEPRQRWRIRLQTGRTYVLGRNVESDLPVPWDPHVSGRHAHLTAIADAVEVTRLPSSSNPLCYAGRRVETCRVGSGEHFVIGSTRFHVVAVDVEAASPDNRPVEEMTFGRRELDKIRYRDAEKRIDVLTRLPQVIEGARSDTELYHHLEHLILAGVVHADAVATVALDEEGSVRVLHWDRRRAAAGDFRPSGRLVSEALGKRGHTVLHVWEAHQQAQEDYTAVAEFDWAYCTPVREPSGDAWGLYVAGTLDRRPMVRS